MNIVLVVVFVWVWARERETEEEAGQGMEERGWGRWKRDTVKEECETAKNGGRDGKGAWGRRERGRKERDRVRWHREWVGKRE